MAGIQKRDHDLEMVLYSLAKPGTAVVTPGTRRRRSGREGRPPRADRFWLHDHQLALAEVSTTASTAADQFRLSLKSRKKISKKCNTNATRTRTTEPRTEHGDQKKEHSSGKGENRTRALYRTRTQATKTKLRLAAAGAIPSLPLPTSAV